MASVDLIIYTYSDIKIGQSEDGHVSDKTMFGTSETQNFVLNHKLRGLFNQHI